MTSTTPLTAQEASIATAFSAENLKKIMSKEGPIVQAVILKTNGTVEEVKYDSTPKKNDITRLLNGDSVTIIGQWADLNVILCGSREEENKKILTNKNTHKLRWPFTDKIIFGDIVCVRMDEEAEPQDFTKSEYLDFASKFEDDKNKPDVSEFEQKFDNPDPNVDVDDENENENDDEIQYMTIPYEVIEKKLKSQFIEKFQREPTDQEMENMVQQLQKMAGMPMHPVTEEDEEFIPDNEDTTDAVDDDDDDDEEMLGEDDEDKENVPVDTNVTEMATALENVRKLAAHDRELILKKAYEKYVEETGEDVSFEEMKSAFENVKQEFIPTSPEKETSPDPDVCVNQTTITTNTTTTTNKTTTTTTETETGQDEDAIMEDVNDINDESEAYAEKELSEAFANIRLLAKQTKQGLENRAVEMFENTYGRKPNGQELSEIFQNVENQFAYPVDHDVTEEEENIEENEEFAQKHNDALPSLEELEKLTFERFENFTGRKPNEQERLLLKQQILDQRNALLENDNEDRDDDYDPKLDESLEQADFEEDEKEAILSSNTTGKTTATKTTTSKTTNLKNEDEDEEYDETEDPDFVPTQQQNDSGSDTDVSLDDDESLGIKIKGTTTTTEKIEQTQVSA